MIKKLLLVFLIFSILSCACNKTSSSKVISENNSTINLVTDFEPIFNDGDINAVIEIPAGTIEKWEVVKKDGQLKHEIKNGIPRIIQYIGYPGNYGMVPRTILPKNLGGDGDPLDVLVLGPPIKRGAVVKCKLIGVLHLLDHDEQDDKLIAVLEGSPLYNVNTIEELDAKYHGVSKIIQLWFTNYKGARKLESKGFGDKTIATSILTSAINEYSKKQKK